MNTRSSPSLSLSVSVCMLATPHGPLKSIAPSSVEAPLVQPPILQGNFIKGCHL